MELYIISEYDGESTYIPRIYFNEADLYKYYRYAVTNYVLERYKMFLYKDYINYNLTPVNNFDEFLKNTWLCKGTNTIVVNEYLTSLHNCFKTDLEYIGPNYWYVRYAKISGTYVDVDCSKHRPERINAQKYFPTINEIDMLIRSWINNHKIEYGKYIEEE